jgi:hypothetical protein
MKENDEKLRDMLRSEEVPEQISPENMKKMLDEKAPKKKRSGIKLAGRIAAGAAACAVIAGSYAGTAHIMNERKNGGSGSSVTSPDKEKKVYVEAPYMNGAESYEDVYSLMKRSSEKYQRQLKKRQNSYITGGFKNEGGIVYDAEVNEESAAYAAPADEGYVSPDLEMEDGFTGESAGKASAPEHSDTYDQEEGVREADIVKTDGKNIYYIWNDRDDYYYDEVEEAYVNSFNHNTPKMDIATVKDGEFTGSKTIDLTPDLSGFDIEGRTNITVTDMYVYNDMIEVIGSIGSASYYYGQYATGGYYIDENGEFHDPVSSTFVSVYSTGDEPELIGTYFQDGYYNDVRIAPDGCMYLISNYNTVDFNSVQDAENIDRYIPCCGVDSEIQCVPPEDILMPIDTPPAKTLLSYTVISGIDLSEAGTFNVVDKKALAGFSGTIYSSAENIYAVVYANTNGSSSGDSDITRIAVSGGTIEPMASGRVEGYVKDQFSMSEYGGYFRIATTISKFHDNRSFFGDVFGTNEPSYTENSNAVTVLDMDLNTVGMIKDFGVNEQIKSVNFSGDKAYVVTFRQTDPLFAIDLSDPANPTILDEFKINGFSTYMQSWGDGLLLGFGQDADDNGRISGLRLTLFDNSDPNNLKAADVFTWNNEDFQDYDYGDDTGTTATWYDSTAVWERKALLIAPEKNLIGVPISISLEHYSNEKGWRASTTSQYVFFSFEDGKFVEKGIISDKLNDEDDLARINSPGFNRAIYIGDYVYALSGRKFVAASIDTLEVTDELVF